VPQAPAYHHELAIALSNNATLLRLGGDPARASQRAEEALPHFRTALRANPKEPLYQAHYLLNRRILAGCRLELGDHQGAAAAAEQIAQDAVSPAKQCFEAAVFLAGCAGLAARDTQLPEAGRKAASAAHADRAMALLAQAVKHGLRNADALRQNRAFDFIRGRPDFRRLVAEMEAGER
jgi:tetratricopeptide (TPR) repeat protein